MTFGGGPSPEPEEEVDNGYGEYFYTFRLPGTFLEALLPYFGEMLVNIGFCAEFASFPPLDRLHPRTTSTRGGGDECERDRTLLRSYEVVPLYHAW